MAARLLRLLSDFQVEYLVVGGYAVIKYMGPRYPAEELRGLRVLRVKPENTFES